MFFLSQFSWKNNVIVIRAPRIILFFVSFIIRSVQSCEKQKSKIKLIICITNNLLIQKKKSLKNFFKIISLQKSANEIL